MATKGMRRTQYLSRGVTKPQFVNHSIGECFDEFEIWETDRTEKIGWVTPNTGLKNTGPIS